VLGSSARTIRPTRPAGWVALGTDCNDANADDCTFVADDGFAAPGVPALDLAPGGLAWSAVSPSTGYDLVRGDLATASGTSCARWTG
jgi:hypothetical protein